MLRLSVTSNMEVKAVTGQFPYCNHSLTIRLTHTCQFLRDRIKLNIEVPCSSCSTHILLLFQTRMKYADTNSEQASYARILYIVLFKT